MFGKIRHEKCIRVLKTIKVNTHDLRNLMNFYYKTVNKCNNRGAKTESYLYGNAKISAQVTNCRHYYLMCKLMKY